MANKKDPKADPSTVSDNYRHMIPQWDKVQTVLDGTEAMRASGETYLPRHEHESSDNYSERLSRATLLNLTDLTLNSWVGRPFSDPVKINDDVNSEIAEWLEDVDLQGNNVTVFGRSFFREGVAKAFDHVLVDFPQVNSVNRTLADDSVENVRPYFSFIRPENLIFMETRVLDGREVLAHVRILEEERVRVGFSEETIQRIRVFDRVFPGESVFSIPGNEPPSAEAIAEMDETLLDELFRPGVFFTLYRKVEHKKGEDEWVIEVPPTRLDDRMDEIPIVTFYADKQDVMLGKSPLADIADLNINWWQSNSDQNIILTVTRFPLLASSGGDEEENVVDIGPKQMLHMPDAQGKFYYVEHSGRAIQAGRDHLADLENQMAHYGAEFLRKKPGNQTATARALDSAEATSPLQDVTVRFNDALNRAIELMGKWAGIENPGTVTVSSEFGPEEVVSGDLDALDKARSRGDLSRQDHFEELKRRGALRDDFDPEENERRLEEEGMNIPEVNIDPFAEE